jgi:hypothetical protein
METLNTIATNLHTLSEAHIDWSLTTGRTTWLSIGDDGFHVTAVEET